MLEKVCDTIVLGVLVGRSRVDKDANGGSFRGDRLRDDAESAWECRDVCGWRVEDVGRDRDDLWLDLFFFFFFFFVVVLVLVRAVSG